MKGVLLAGGSGTRLRPLTNIVNKHLIAVYDRPMIEYPINILKALGMQDILVVSGREHAGGFLNYLGSGKDHGVNFTYKVQEEAGGIAEALGLAEDFANGEPVAVILGDNFFQYSFGIAGLPVGDTAFVFLKSVHDPERFGVAELVATEDNEKGHVVKEIVEKPSKPKTNLAVTGLYLYPNLVFEAIRMLRPSERGELEITDVNNFFIKQGRLRAIKVDGFWSDMGTPQSLALTTQHILENLHD